MQERLLDDLLSALIMWASVRPFMKLYSMSFTNNASTLFFLCDILCCLHIVALGCKTLDYRWAPGFIVLFFVVSSAKIFQVLFQLKTVDCYAYEGNLVSLV